jgi:hypothetical protein
MEDNPKAGFIYRLLGMVKVQAGFVQEGQEMFAKGIKGFPASLQNVRSFLAYYNFKDHKVMKSFAEGFSKAGLPGRTDDYYKISSEKRLNEKELRKLFLGRKVTGIELATGKQWWVERSDNGYATIREGDKSDTGKSWVEDDMLCDQWDNFYENLKDCWVVYRNSEGAPKDNDEYLGAPGYGIYPFSLVK